MVQIEIDESATIESEDTPYIVYAYFVSGRSVVIGRFETEEAAIECMGSFARRMKWKVGKYNDRKQKNTEQPTQADSWLMSRFQKQEW